MVYQLMDFDVRSIFALDDSSVALIQTRDEIPIALSYMLNESEQVTTVVDPGQNIIYSWGKGKTGCLGHGSYDDIYTPTPISFSFEEMISKVAAGKNHVFALDSSKNVAYSWGNNNYGQLSFELSIEKVNSPK
jgi:alpha-tubulin suppressor-like RCC1 family protein